MATGDGSDTEVAGQGSGKKWLMVIVALALCGGIGWWFFGRTKGSDQQTTASAKVEAAQKAKKEADEALEKANAEAAKEKKEAEAKSQPPVVIKDAPKADAPVPAAPAVVTTKAAAKILVVEVNAVGKLAKDSTWKAGATMFDGALVNTDVDGVHFKDVDGTRLLAPVDWNKPGKQEVTLVPDTTPEPTKKAIAKAKVPKPPKAKEVDEDDDEDEKPAKKPAKKEGAGA